MDVVVCVVSPQRSMHFVPYCSGGGHISTHMYIGLYCLSLKVETERVDAGRDSQTRFARPNYQTRTPTGKTFCCSPKHEEN